MHRRCKGIDNRDAAPGEAVLQVFGQKHTAAGVGGRGEDEGIPDTKTMVGCALLAITGAGEWLDVPGPSVPLPIWHHEAEWEARDDGDGGASHARHRERPEGALLAPGATDTSALSPPPPRSRSPPRGLRGSEGGSRP